MRTNNKNHYSHKRDESATRGFAPFAVVEAYKTIRTNLIYMLSQQEKKMLVVSSAVSGEGKSTTAINIGIAFSQLGNKTLVVDADLRKPSIHKKIKVSNQKGLSSVLVGFDKISDVVNNVNTNLDVITSGPIPPNPSEILSSEAMDRVIDIVGKQYDYVIFDTPPVDIVTDALALAPKTAGILMVVKNGFTTHDDFKKAVSTIEVSKVKMLGVVMNNASLKVSKYYRKKGRKKYGYDAPSED